MYAFEIVLALFIFTLFLMLTLVLVIGGRIKYKGRVTTFIDRFRYVPKRLAKLYEFEFLNGGFSFGCEKNSTSSYKYASKLEAGVIIPIQFSKDFVPFCFASRYMSRYTGVPGKFSHIRAKEVRKYYSKKIKISSLEESLNVIGENVPVLLKVNGILSVNNVFSLISVLSLNKCEFFIQTNSITTYLFLNFISATKGKIIYKYNFFRKGIKVLDDAFFDDLVSIDPIDIVISIEESLSIENLTHRLSFIVRKCSSRVKEDDIIFTRPIVHRAIIDSGKYREHEIKAIKECWVRGCIPEVDIIYKDGELLLYHSDKFSGSIIRQPASAAEKVEVKNSPKLKDVLKLVDQMKNLKVPPAIVLDIKDAKPFNRTLQKELVYLCNKYSHKIQIYIFCYNPFVSIWLSKQARSNFYIRGALFNSLEGINAISDLVGIALSALLSNTNKADINVWNIGSKKWAIIFQKMLRNFQIKYGLVYAPKNQQEYEPYRKYFANCIAENVAIEELWNEVYDYDKKTGIITLKADKSF